MDTERFRTSLLEERDRLRQAVEYIHDERESTQEDDTDHELASSDNHMGDAASNMLERELSDGLEAGGEDVLGQIDAALKRIEDGAYGTCVRCGKEIGEERLEARPWATLCIEHARAGGM